MSRPQRRKRKRRRPTRTALSCQYRGVGFLANRSLVLIPPRDNGVRSIVPAILVRSLAARCAYGARCRYVAENVCIDTDPLSRKNKRRIPGKLRVVEHAGTKYLEWMPYLRGPHASTIPNAGNYAVRQLLSDVRSFQRSRAGLVIISTVASLPPFHFEAGTSACKQFVRPVVLSANVRHRCIEKLATNPNPARPQDLFLGKVLKETTTNAESPPAPSDLQSRIEVVGQRMQSVGLNLMHQLSRIAAAVNDAPTREVELASPDNFQEVAARNEALESSQEEASETARTPPAFGSATVQTNDLQCTEHQSLGDLGTFDVIEALPPLRKRDRGPAVTSAVFQSFVEGCTVKRGSELRRLVFEGGVVPGARKQVWKYLLGYQW